MATLLLSPYLNPTAHLSKSLLMAENFNLDNLQVSPCPSPGATPIPTPVGGSPNVSPLGSPASSSTELPHLPVDRVLSPVVLRRRLAISSAGGRDASGDEDEDEGPPSATRPRMKRRGAVSYNPNDSSAMYIRYLVEAIVRSKERPFMIHGRLPLLPNDTLDLSLSPRSRAHYRRGSLQQATASSVYKERIRGSVIDSMDIAPSTLHLDANIDNVLRTIDMWDFDVFSFGRLAEGRPLLHIGMNLFHRHKLSDTFSLDPLKLFEFLTQVEHNYHPENSYHNSYHAADVTQALHCLIVDPVVYAVLSPVEVLSIFLAALCHDLDHPGVNHDYLVNSGSYLTAIHGTNSLLERHHCQSARGILRETGLLDHLPEKHSIIALMEDLILATDVSKHKEFLNKFEGKLDSKRGMDLRDPKDRHFALMIAIKVADISNPARPLDISRQWSYKIMEEFFQQGDLEKISELPVSYLCDRKTTKIPKSQSGFFQFCALPLYKAWGKLVQSNLADMMVHNTSINKDFWDDKHLEEEEREAALKLIEEDVGEANLERRDTILEAITINKKNDEPHLLECNEPSPLESEEPRPLESDEPRLPENNDSLPLESDNPRPPKTAESRLLKIPVLKVTAISEDGEENSETLIEPEETLVEPEETPVEPEETPVEPEETPVEPEETPVESEETPVEPEETPVEPEETLVEPKETPVEPKETLVEPEETLVEPKETLVEPEETKEDEESDDDNDDDDDEGLGKVEGTISLDIPMTITIRRLKRNAAGKLEFDSIIATASLLDGNNDKPEEDKDTATTTTSSKPEEGRKKREVMVPAVVTGPVPKEADDEIEPAKKPYYLPVIEDLPQVKLEASGKDKKKMSERVKPVLPPIPSANRSARPVYSGQRLEAATSRRIFSRPPGESYSDLSGLVVEGEKIQLLNRPPSCRKPYSSLGPRQVSPRDPPPSRPATGACVHRSFFRPSTVSGTPSADNETLWRPRAATRTSTSGPRPFRSTSSTRPTTSSLKKPSFVGKAPNLRVNTAPSTTVRELGVVRGRRHGNRRRPCMTSDSRRDDVWAAYSRRSWELSGEIPREAKK